MFKCLIPTILLIAYGAILIKVMVFKDIPTIRVGQLMLNFGGTNAGHAPNFVPFKTILPYLFGFKGLIIAGINLIGNIALLVPVGFIIPFVWRDAAKNMTWKKSLMVGFAAGFSIEILQAILRVGIFDIDDVILNALGVLVGYAMFSVLAKWMNAKKYLRIAVSTILIVFAAAYAFYSIYPKTPVTRPISGAVGTDKAGTDNIGAQNGQGGDLCGGTNGTGEIIGREESGDGTIILKRNDGTPETIDLAEKTVIKNSSGVISASDLKIGDRATVVIMGEARVADAVLVCGI